MMADMSGGPQLPDEGFGAMTRRRIWADIVGSGLTPNQLFEHFRAAFPDLMPWTADVRTGKGGQPTLSEGTIIRFPVPLREDARVRVVEVTPVSLTLVTLEGHPLAGGVRFLSEQRGGLNRFEVQVYERASGVVDWITMKAVGHRVQGAIWSRLVEAVVERSGGEAPAGVEEESETLDAYQARDVERWLADLAGSARPSEMR
jgi:NADH dehydrogenase